jgi:hypothetical protein
LRPGTARDRLRSSGFAETNDLGDYRLATRPGRYYLQADPGFLTRVWDKRYTSLFYPGATNPEEAHAIELKSGQTVNGIDIRLEPRQGAQVRGRVVWPATCQRSRYERFLLRQQIPNGGAS